MIDESDKKVKRTAPRFCKTIRLNPEKLKMHSDSSRPVFIIGGSRTGSTMLQTILSTSPEVSMTDELQFRSPWWLHRDLVADIGSHVGPLDHPGALDRLLDLLYSGIPVWKN